MTGTKWNTKEEQIQQGFLWALEPEATQQKMRFEEGTDPDNDRIDKKIKVHNRYSLPKRNINNSRGAFLGKTSRYGNIGRLLGKINSGRKKIPFSGI